MRALLAVFVVAAMVCGDPTAAEACSCYGPGPLIYPRDGEEEVPTNAGIVSRRLPVSALIEEATRRAVPFEATRMEDASRHDWWTARPVEPLEPRTRYVIEGDDIQGYFTTGDGADDEAPAATTLRSASLAVWRDEEVQSSCDSMWVGPDGVSDPRRTYACLGIDSPATDVILLTYRLERTSPDAGEALLVVAPHDDEEGQRSWDSAASTHTCDLRAPPFLPGERWSVTVTSWDGALHTSDSLPISADTVECDSTESCGSCAASGPVTAPPLGRPGPSYPQAGIGTASGCSASGSPQGSGGLLGFALLLAAGARRAQSRARRR